MTIAVSFGSQTITNAEPIVTEQSAYSMKCEIKGATQNPAEIAALRALAGPSKSSVLLSGKTKIQTLGTKSSLVIGTATYSNCVIMDGVKDDEVHGTGGTWWKYSFKVEQETI